MELNAMLEELAESPAPASTVDIRRAAASGRRTIRLRRAVAAGSTAVVVVVVAGLLNVLLATGSALPPVPPPAASALPTPTTSPRPMPNEARVALGVLVQYADFGWLPPGSTSDMVASSANWLSLEALYLGGPTSDRGDAAPGRIRLVVASAGHGVDADRYPDFAVPVDSMPPGNDAPPVNGRRAQWVGGLALRWEYAPGAWAIAEVDNVIGVDPKDAVRRVAENAVFGVDTPIRLPFTTNAIPAGLSPRVIQVTRNGSGDWTTNVDYGTSDERPPSGDWPLTILATKRASETGDNSVIGDPTTTVDGHPARTSGLLDGGSGLQLFNVDGVYLELLTHSRATTQSLPGGSLIELFRSMRLYPDPTTWR